MEIISELGLYRREEHDACGVGFVAQLGQAPSHRVLEQAIECLRNLTHRGGVDADAASGDGAGIMVQLPGDFFCREAGRLNFFDVSNSKIAVGVFFLPQDREARAEAMRVAEKAVERRKLRVVGWRRVPVDESALGSQARETMPDIRHLLISGAPGRDREYEQELYLLRREIEQALARSTSQNIETAGLRSATYIASFSSRNIVYKGLLSPEQIGRFYRDLADPDFVTSAALFHQRYSTNTRPSWLLAQPFRLVAHNGEINTLLGNRNWMRAREAVLAHRIWAQDVDFLKPVAQPGVSDSASFDNVLELLTRSGRSVQHALLMMIPEAWESSVEIADDIKAFYHFHSCLMEAWDGPAAMAFLDGPVVGAALDRNGLRPARYTITHDGLVVLGSEAGILAIEPGRVKEKGRLGPGQILVVDLKHQKILKNDLVKRQVSRGRHYRRWILQNMLFAPRLAAADTALGRGDNPGQSRQNDADPSLFVATQRACGYTEEDIDLLLKPMAAEKKEAVGSMGDDSPLAALSHQPRPLYHYFRQMFAQVTNPPIDPLRESLVMSLSLYLGSRHSVLVETPDHARMIRLESPFLFDDELSHLTTLGAGYFKPVTISTLYEFNAAMSDEAGNESLTGALVRITDQCVAAVAQGSSILVLSDRGIGAGQAPVPMLLVVGAVTERLIAENVGNKADVAIETAEVWEPHQFACLVGYGAAAINPYLALEIVAAETRRGEFGPIAVAEALGNYRATVEAGLKKIMSKMGISTLASYMGGKFFEIIGLDQQVVQRFFPDTRSLVGGRTYNDIARDALARHRSAFERPATKLDSSGLYRFRKGMERHAYSADVLRHLQKAAKENDPAAYRKLADELDKREPLAIRDLLRFRPGTRPVPIDEVEPAADIMRRFTTQAMSLGSLSPETQRTLAIAMNRIGGKSNTGEGGEDPDVYLDLVNGESAAHKIKQVASGRFGVTPEYLVRAEELEIKMAQGSKPGEGGQLPAHKVTPLIARVRRAVTGIGLISPPPHHDIYSIEDLAQLIYDLREINPRARIGVKLVSQAGVGTVAAGVAKANADVVLISGHDGGTGASPLVSIKNTGSPWEMGLAEVHQALVANGLRHRLRLRADGGLKTGRDVVIAAMLGANEYGFGSAALVALACVMARQCHLNTCPVGVATQREDLRLKFPSEPERLIHYFQHVAGHVREILAGLGFRSLDEVVGRTDLLEAIEHRVPGREGYLDVRPLLARTEPVTGTEKTLREPVISSEARNLALKAHTARDSWSPAAPRSDRTDESFRNLTGASSHPGTAGLSSPASRSAHIDPLALQLVEDARPALQDHVWIKKDYVIRNTNRTIGARAAGEIARARGDRGLGASCAEFRFNGSAGQSFGAFLVQGMRMILEGEANDYVGKGMAGGEIVIRPPREIGFEPHLNTIIGNAVLYGATGGRLFAAGRAGERFAVRNSGAIAVVEGVGDHGCEYMTGGVVVIVGETGRNFGAGMTNGVAYIYDPAHRFERRYNPELITAGRIIDAEDSHFLRQLLFFHLEETGSQRAREILDAWEQNLLQFWKVQPGSRIHPTPKLRVAALALSAG